MGRPNLTPKTLIWKQDVISLGMQINESALIGTQSGHIKGPRWRHAFFYSGNQCIFGDPCGAKIMPGIGIQQ